jgi:hypothetical protein
LAWECVCLRVLRVQPEHLAHERGAFAFLNLERAREMVASGHSFEEALASTRATAIFTTPHQFRRAAMSFLSG